MLYGHILLASSANGIKERRLLLSKSNGDGYFVGLLYQACELYIDDILVFGKDEEHFLANLKKVFERLRKMSMK